MPDSLGVLAFDTAMGSCSVACLPRHGGAGAPVSWSVEMRHGHACALLPAIQDVMAKAGQRFGDIDLIAVTTGPGSFTGIRTGLATARALGLARSIPVVGITTLEALARQSLARAPLAHGAALGVFVDSRRDELYFQFFGAGGAPMGPAGMDGPQSLPMPAGCAVRAVGDGAARLATRASPAVKIGETARIDPVFLGVLALQHYEQSQALGHPLPAASPFYLRPPDATPPASKTRINSK